MVRIPDAPIRPCAGRFVRLRGYTMKLTLETLPPDLRKELLKTPAGKRNKFSLTPDGIEKIFPALLQVARAPERMYDRDDLTSHDCAALFQGKKWMDGRWTEEVYEHLKFHPVDMFPQYYSEKMPDRMQSYPWAIFWLIKDLRNAINEYEKIVPNDNRSETYWLDILVNDQNSTDMKLFLDLADVFYANAPRHFALLCGGFMDRAWCISEMITRYIAALKILGLWKEGQDKTDGIIQGGEHLQNGHPAFTTFITVPGLTDLYRDIICGGECDRFRSMQAFKEEDLQAIQDRAEEKFGRPETFKFMCAVIRSLVLSHYADTHKVHRASACSAAGRAPPRCSPVCPPLWREMDRPYRACCARPFAIICQACSSLSS